jgi:GNAT superfamily N-acetyltransferase
MITIEESDPRSDDSQQLIEYLSAELASITGSSGKSNFNLDDVLVPGARWVIARDTYNKPVGCGAFRPISETTVELKRMFSSRALPGIGAAILAWLEEAARQLGYREIWLETRVVNAKAVGFYLKQGYVKIPEMVSPVRRLKRRWKSDRRYQSRQRSR